jgi:DNA-binding NarL/FixJ family response regulator
MITIAIVEDLPDYREAMRSLLDRSGEFVCTGAFADAETAMKELPAQCPDIAMVDIGLPGMNGIELIRFITAHCPRTLCMICTAYDEDEKVYEALEAGAYSYILKSSSPSAIIDALLELHRGGSPMSSEVARKVVMSLQKKKMVNEKAGLTGREKEIMELLSKGLLYKEIAAKLGIGIETVRSHCFRIYEKLHANNRTEAINRYYSKN